MFKYNPFVAPKEHSTNKTFLKCGFNFRSSAVLNRLKSVLMHTISGGEMRLPTIVRLAIWGIVLSIIFVLKECVSTLHVFTFKHE